MASRVKNRRQRTASRISAKHQVTIPADAFEQAGLQVGDRLVAKADGPGRVVLERQLDVVAEYAGALTGVYEGGGLGSLRVGLAVLGAGVLMGCGRQGCSS